MRFLWSAGTEGKTDSAAAMSPLRIAVWYSITVKERA